MVILTVYLNNQGYKQAVHGHAKQVKQNMHVGRTTQTVYRAMESEHGYMSLEANRQKHVHEV